MRTRIALALCGALLAGPALAADPPVKVEVPYRLTDTKHILVRAKINGHGPFNLILDTGAPAVILPEKVAERAKAKKNARGWADFDSFVLEGGLTVTKATGRIEDFVQLDGMNTMGAAGVELHGVIGYNVLARYRIHIDLTTDKLVFEELAGFEPPALKQLGGSGRGLQDHADFMKVAAKMLGRIPNFDTVPRGFTGIEYEEKNGKIVVTRVLPGTAAAKAGIKPGDVIVAVKDTVVDSDKDFAKALAKTNVGAKVKLTISRDGKERDLTVELGKGL